MDRTLIENLITKHEGRRASVYHDTKGKLTIAIGWNLDAPDSDLIASHFALDLADLKNGTATLTDAQIEEVFEYQLNDAIRGAMSLLPNFDSMPDVVQAVVVDQVFNLGESGFSKFHSEINALKSGDWKAAATAAKASLWFHQVGARGIEDVALLESA